MAEVHGTQRRHIAIDPITRLEGHGRIDVFLDDMGEVERAYFRATELRGFEAFCVGRPAEEMPQITSRICGVCPMAHHMAATKALDDLYRVTPTPTARKVRELVYNAFMLEDHALHVFLMGGPDFFVGPDAPASERNLQGVFRVLGEETARSVVSMRRRLRDFIASIGGKAVHPVLGLPGGVAKGIDAGDLPAMRELGRDALEFAQFVLSLVRRTLVDDKDYRALLTSEAYTHRTYYMGLVDVHDRMAFYSGRLRVVAPDGREFARFDVGAYLMYLAEHMEPWSYVKFCHLKALGWQGFVDGPASGIYAVAPLGRLNASVGMPTAIAQAAREDLHAVLGAGPIHHTMANHWARAIEMVCAAERIVELLNDPEIAGRELRTRVDLMPSEGIGVVEAPRGTLIHHYETDDDGLIRYCKLTVATQHNAARIALSVDRAAKSLIHGGNVSDGLLNRIEMAFRAYDPCNACATHDLPGTGASIVRIFTNSGEEVRPRLD